MPRVSFIEMPSRREIASHTVTNSQDLKIYYHPQGTHVAVMNEYLKGTTKQAKYSIELFETKDGNLNSIPKQQVKIDREVEKFNSVIWEPNHTKFAVHTLSKKTLRPGER